MRINYVGAQQQFPEGKTAGNSLNEKELNRCQSWTWLSRPGWTSMMMHQVLRARGWEWPSANAGRCPSARGDVSKNAWKRWRLQKSNKINKPEQYTYIQLAWRSADCICIRQHDTIQTRIYRFAQSRQWDHQAVTCVVWSMCVLLWPDHATLGAIDMETPLTSGQDRSIRQKANKVVNFCSNKYSFD